jgi:serine/threonine protein kinase
MRPQFETAFGGSRAGTPGFRAPEVLLGRGATTRSDIYSFGCALFATLHGEVCETKKKIFFFDLDLNRLHMPENTHLCNFGRLAQSVGFQIGTRKRWLDILHFYL